jgi:hypothetical protein
MTGQYRLKNDVCSCLEVLRSDRGNVREEKNWIKKVVSKKIMANYT